MHVSIIIPTLNEAKLLPHLLEDLTHQTYGDMEIIVADAGSADNTVSIAQQFGAIVTPGGLPAAGRNAGARIAAGEFLVFLDADVRVPADFLQNAMHEIEDRFLDLATCEFRPLSAEPLDKFLHNFVNTAIKVYQFMDPHAPGFCILVSRRLFRRIGGFDETLHLAEDHNFVRRASVFRPLRVLESTAIEVSIRRLSKEGRMRLTSKYLQVELLRLFGGEIRDDAITYEFGRFEELRKNPVFPDLLKDARARIQRVNAKLSETLTHQPAGDDVSAEFHENIEDVKRQFEKLKTDIRAMFKL